MIILLTKSFNRFSSRFSHRSFWKNFILYERLKVKNFSRNSRELTLFNVTLKNPSYPYWSQGFTERKATPSISMRMLLRSFTSHRAVSCRVANPYPLLPLLRYNFRKLSLSFQALSTFVSPLAPLLTLSSTPPHPGVARSSGWLERIKKRHSSYEPLLGPDTHTHIFLLFIWFCLPSRLRVFFYFTGTSLYSLTLSCLPFIWVNPIRLRVSKLFLVFLIFLISDPFLWSQRTQKGEADQHWRI